MDVIPIKAFSDNYIWLIINNTDKSAICVDPGDAKPVLDFLAQTSLQLQAILITHHHYDHIGGVAALLSANPKISVYGPNDTRIPKVTKSLRGGDTVSMAPFLFHVIATPGHTSSHISFFEANFGWLFCGDTLFSAGCGRVFDGTMEELYTSLQTLKNLPDSTKIYCAHEYTRNNLRFATQAEPDNLEIMAYLQSLEDYPCSLPTTVEVEKRVNPFFRAPNIALFSQLRVAKDHFS